MPSSQELDTSDISPPKICIQRATPESSQEQGAEHATRPNQPGGLPPRRTKSLLARGSPPCHSLPRHSRKRSTTTAGIHDTLQDSKMAPRSPRSSPDKGRTNNSSPPSSTSSKRTKSNSKEGDWADVTDPEQRRRIQNRIAQRKFREKARENREKAERESRNHENAGNSYRIPLGSDISTEDGLSGLPWGSVNLNFAISRGHETEGRRSSGKGTFLRESGQPPESHSNSFSQTPSHGSSGADEALYDESGYWVEGVHAFRYPSL